MQIGAAASQVAKDVDSTGFGGSEYPVVENLDKMGLSQQGLFETPEEQRCLA